MSKKKSIKVIKIPNDKAINPRPKAFPRMPRLYLELLENKAKIKQDLINKEYVPQRGRSSSPDYNEPRRSQELTRHNHPIREKYSADRIIENEEKEINNTPENKNDKPPLEFIDDKENFSDQEMSESGSSSGNSSIASAGSDDDALSIRLKELLNETDSESDINQSIKRNELRESPRYRGTPSPVQQNPPRIYQPSPRQENIYQDRRKEPPPTLAELAAKGNYIHKKAYRDLEQPVYNEQEEEDLKREILFKFDLLRKSYKSAIIPEFTIHSDLHSMKKSYDATIRRLSLDSTVDNYKTYLIGGFMLVEYVLGSWLGFDMQGFTQQQIVSMSSYERLLIELGEKSYVPGGSKWPVEIRLIFLIIINAAFFIVSKMILKKTGSNVLGMINSMNTAPVPKKKRKMRGPAIDLEDLPDINFEGEKIEINE
uniref:Uncharacterized protein n=1 Tax=Iridovirus LCIVAC01 TaxID=2506607 RepID=A0A481YSE7_9VIRU|nr:MAG: uncharacterized protein LCIVAC01_01930 [Iridovirus LCIVAC01]